MGKHAQYGKVAPAIQYGAEGSVLQNLPSRVHPAENLLKQAVWWIDAAHSTSGGQSIRNLGWGGAVLDAQAGSTSGADSNDPKYLDWQGENYVYLPGSSGNYLSVPDSAALDITGDIDIRVKVALDDWTPGTVMILMSKDVTASNWSWVFYIDTNGYLWLTNYPDGTTTVGVSSSVPITGIADGGIKWVRTTLDVDNGASGHDKKFFTSDDGVTWTQLGTTRTVAGTTSIFSGTSEVEIGAYRTGGLPLAGKIYEAVIKSGIEGTTVLDVDCQQITSGSATSFLANTGQTVTINRTASGRKTVAVTQPCWLFGTDDAMSIPNNTLLSMGSTSDFTYFAVIRKWTNANAGVFYNGNATPPNSYLDNDSTNLRAVARDGTNTIVATVPNTLGSVIILAGTLSRAAGTLTVTANGVSGSAAIGGLGTVSNANPLAVGSANGAAYSDMEGVAFAVFRRALTTSEVALLSDYYLARSE